MTDSCFIHIIKKKHRNKLYSFFFFFVLFLVTTAQRGSGPPLCSGFYIINNDTLQSIEPLDEWPALSQGVTTHTLSRERHPRPDGSYRIQPSIFTSLIRISFSECWGLCKILICFPLRVVDSPYKPSMSNKNNFHLKLLLRSCSIKDFLGCSVVKWTGNKHDTDTKLQQAWHRY
jgi:hypothetical protein